MKYFFSSPLANFNFGSNGKINSILFMQSFVDTYSGGPSFKSDLGISGFAAKSNIFLR
jgi:hypothetical protein